MSKSKLLCVSSPHKKNDNSSKNNGFTQSIGWFQWLRTNFPNDVWTDESFREKQKVQNPMFFLWQLKTFHVNQHIMKKTLFKCQVDQHYFSPFCISFHSFTNWFFTQNSENAMPCDLLKMLYILSAKKRYTINWNFLIGMCCVSFFRECMSMCLWITHQRFYVFGSHVCTAFLVKLPLEGV